VIKIAKIKKLEKFFSWVTVLSFFLQTNSAFFLAVPAMAQELTPETAIVQEAEPTPYNPIEEPTPVPTQETEPTQEPTVEPTVFLQDIPSTPTLELTQEPTQVLVSQEVTPTTQPTQEPTAEPTIEPTISIEQPTIAITEAPTNIPQEQNSTSPTSGEEVKGEEIRSNEDPTPTPTIQPTITQTPLIECSIRENKSEISLEKVCLTDEEVKDSTDDLWNFDTITGIAETQSKVQLGVRYTFPLEKKVSVLFKCLPKDEELRTSLKIQQIKISDLKLPEEIKPATEYAYDITTSMANGTFEYDVTLPKAESQITEVLFVEKSADEIKALNEPLRFEEFKTVESNINQEGEVVKASGIDHFTVFIPTIDVDGANDKPGQMDLTKFSFGLIGTKKYEATFSWDEVGITNPVDACVLINTDSDTGVNYAVCVHYDDGGLYSTRLYSCSDKDNKPVNCWDSSLLSSINPVFTTNTLCSVATTNDDPFPTTALKGPGDDYPYDRTASCIIEFQSTFTDSIEISNVCSYPSGPPNSNAGDCLAYEAGGFLQIIKAASPSDSTVFNFSVSNGSSASITGSGQSQLISVNAGKYSITETVPSGWNFNSATCDGGTPTTIVNGVGDIDVAGGNTIVCTFNNTKRIPALTIVKTATPATYDEVGDVISYSYKVTNSYCCSN